MEFVRSTLSEGWNWMSNSVGVPIHFWSQRDIMEDEEERDSIWSSEDEGKSRDNSMTDEAEENYFSCPIDDSLLHSQDEIEDAIEKVKGMVLETEGVSEERRKLVKRLISLRLRLQELKDIEEERGDCGTEEFRIISQHHFLIQNQIVHRTAQYCDRCLGVIWTVIQQWYRCRGCHYQCHAKCLNNVVRNCASSRVGITTEYIQDICPEVGLPDQNYVCWECKARFTLKNSWMEPRRCDYNGRYYCPLCHKNNGTSIPARILHNWDFDPQPVAEESRQFLMLMAKKPNINLDKVNPKLFTFVEDLNIIKKYREDIIIMKDFFRTCRNAIAHKLLRRLDERQHFVETSHMYSLQDLIDVNNGSLLKFLEKIHADYERHIKEECQICYGKGFICEICENVQAIFPFDIAIHVCPSCHAVFHNICFAKRESCPKCLRKSRRASSIPKSGVQ